MGYDIHKVLDIIDFVLNMLILRTDSIINTLLEIQVNVEVNSNMS